MKLRIYATVAAIAVTTFLATSALAGISGMVVIYDYWGQLSVWA